jgi:hypothetical protein
MKRRSKEELKAMPFEELLQLKEAHEEVTSKRAVRYLEEIKSVIKNRKEYWEIVDIKEITIDNYNEYKTMEVTVEIKGGWERKVFLNKMCDEYRSLVRHHRYTDKFIKEILNHPKVRIKRLVQ